MGKNERCKECFDEGTVLVYFVNHKNRTIIEEWEFCKSCHPGSDAFYDHLPATAEPVSLEEAEMLIKEKGYEKYVP